MTLKVEFVWATAEQQILENLELPEGSTIGDAIEASGICQQFPDIDFDSLDVGIWGQIKRRGSQVRDGDRVEVYRELLLDPREARRERAKD